MDAPHRKAHVATGSPRADTHGPRSRLTRGHAPGSARLNTPPACAMNPSPTRFPRSRSRFPGDLDRSGRRPPLLRPATRRFLFAIQQKLFPGFSPLFFKAVSRSGSGGAGAAARAAWTSAQAALSQDQLPRRSPDPAHARPDSPGRTRPPWPRVLRVAASGKRTPQGGATVSTGGKCRGRIKPHLGE